MYLGKVKKGLNSPPYCFGRVNFLTLSGSKAHKIIGTQIFSQDLHHDKLMTKYLKFNSNFAILVEKVECPTPDVMIIHLTIFT